MAATPAAPAIPLHYQTPQRRAWPAYCAAVVFQVGIFATMAATLVVGDRSALRDWLQAALPAWLSRAGPDVMIFCWIGHTIGLIAFVVATLHFDPPRAARGLFSALLAGMLYPLLLLIAVQLGAMLVGTSGAAGAAIVFLAPLLASGAGLALVRRAHDVTVTETAQWSLPAR
jgi:hypothetical protein